MIRPEKLSDAVTLYEGDCLDVLPTLGDSHCDHVITDPPYAEKTHVGARTGTGDTVLVDFDSITDEQFHRVAELCVVVASRWVVLTCDWRHAAFAESEGRVPVIRTGVWIKPDASPQLTGDRPGTGWEAVLILHREGRKRWNNGGHHAVWTHPVERNNVHRTQKPLNLIRRWIREFTDPGDMILDPFAGSGTTAHAALIEGRRAILIEKDPHYCDIIRRRIADAEATGPQSLFKNVKHPELFANSVDDRIGKG